MQYLLEDLQLDIKKTDDNGRNVFHRAVMNDDHGLQIAKMVNEKDGELKFQKDNHGKTALNFFANEELCLIEHLKLESQSSRKFTPDERSKLLAHRQQSMTD